MPVCIHNQFTIIISSISRRQPQNNILSGDFGPTKSLGGQPLLTCTILQKKGNQGLEERAYHNHIIYIPSHSTKKNLLGVSFMANNVYVNSFFNLNNKIDFAFVNFITGCSIYMCSVNTTLSQEANISSFLVQESEDKPHR